VSRLRTLAAPNEQQPEHLYFHHLEWPWQQLHPAAPNEEQPEHLHSYHLERPWQQLHLAAPSEKQPEHLHSYHLERPWKQLHPLPGPAAPPGWMRCRMWPSRGSQG